MKNITKLFGIIALIAAIGLSALLANCQQEPVNDTNIDNKPPDVPVVEDPRLKMYSDMYNYLNFCATNHYSKHLNYIRDNVPATDSELFEIQGEYWKCYTDKLAELNNKNGTNYVSRVNGSLVQDEDTGAVIDYFNVNLNIRDFNSSTKMNGVDSTYKREIIGYDESNEFHYGSTFTGSGNLRKSSNFVYVTSKINGQEVPIFNYGLEK